VRGGNSPKGAVVADHLRFRRSAGLGIVFFSFSLFSFFFFWACLCYGLQQFVVSCGCYINIAGRKPVSNTSNYGTNLLPINKWNLVFLYKILCVESFELNS
jgi:hypothetical protein